MLGKWFCQEEPPLRRGFSLVAVGRGRRIRNGIRIDYVTLFRRPSLQGRVEFISKQ